MEYLEKISDPLKTIDESGIDYINLCDRPDIVFGTLNFSGNAVDFNKMSPEAGFGIPKFNKVGIASYRKYAACSAGCRIRFRTDSGRIIIKARFQIDYYFQKLSGYTSLGFDVYTVDDGKYTHVNTFAPTDGITCYAEEIKTDSEKDYCIFMPDFNTVEEMYIGLEQDRMLVPVYYDNPDKIIIYGNSVTQGNCAGRSGHSFPNILSRMEDCDIINLSVADCCKGQISIARMIGQLNCTGIIIDYSRNENTAEGFEQNYERFYLTLRKYHPDTRVVFMTSTRFNGSMRHAEYDKTIKAVYDGAKSRGENVALVDQTGLFSEDEIDIISSDGTHYTSEGMFRVAKALADAIHKDSEESHAKTDPGKYEEMYNRMILRAEKADAENALIYKELHETRLERDAAKKKLAAAEKKNDSLKEELLGANKKIEELSSAGKSRSFFGRFK